LAKVAKIIGVNPSTISILWKRARNCEKFGVDNEAEILSKRGMRGRKPLFDRNAVKEHVKAKPLRERKTTRGLAKALGLAPSTIHRLIHIEKILKPHSAAVKPALTEENKYARYLFSLEHIDPRTGLYYSMMNTIHVDEKWFYMIETKSRCYLASDEDIPAIYVKHKCHIPKIMFLCAVARPRYDTDKKAWWDGKIGIWPFAKQLPAQRNSKNRAKGTLEWTNVTVKMEQYKAMIVDKVLPAVAQTWPNGSLKTPKFIQQDNAPVHARFTSADPDFVGKAAELGLDIAMFNQPPNSPDTNIQDLAFFRMIDSKHKLNCPNTLEELIDSVYKAFEEMSYVSLNKAFITLQSCMNEIIECNGGNDYKIPHMGKDKMIRERRLPVCLKAPADVVQLLLQE
jgi:hypothetical protein